VLKAAIGSIITGVDASDITIQNYYDPYYRRRRLPEQGEQMSSLNEEIELGDGNGDGDVSGNRMYSSYTTVVYQISISSVLKAGFSSAQDAYDKTTKELTDSVNDGTFTSKIYYYANSYNVGVMRYVQANQQPTISDYSTTNGSLAGAIAVIVISILFPLCCCGCFAVAAYLFHKSNANRYGSRGNIIVPMNQPMSIPMQTMSSPVVYMPQGQQQNGSTYPYAAQPQFSPPMAHAQPVGGGYNSNMPPQQPYAYNGQQASYPQASYVHSGIPTAQPVAYNQQAPVGSGGA
jgi:hypothetical protein